MSDIEAEYQPKLAERIADAIPTELTATPHVGAGSARRLKIACAVMPVVEAELRARLAEVEAERDAAREAVSRVDRVLNEFGIEYPLGHRGVEDIAAMATGRLEDLQAVEANRDAMRPVVEAAEAWRNEWTAQWMKALEPIPRPHSPLVQLIAAVDAYRAAQKAPATITNATESQDQAEPAVASTNTAQAQEGVPGRGYTFAELFPDGLPAAPAAPPGLDAAIEAATKAVRELEAMTTDGYIEQRLEINAAVRAAAPALRAGALRDLADEIDGMLHEDYAPHPGDLARWMRERADRIGGAT